VKVASITFDDGSERKRSQYELAAPLLAKLGVKATFYVCPVGIKDWKPWLELDENGHELGSHTMTHPNLRAMAAGEPFHRSFLDFEIAGSKKAIEDKTGRECETFAYPYGEINWRVVDKVMQHYQGARAGNLKYRGCNTVPPADRFLLLQQHIHHWAATKAADAVYKKLAAMKSCWTIVILHNVISKAPKGQPLRPNTLGMVELAIKNIRRAGYEFMTVRDALRAIDGKAKA